jgi:prepilin-type N-terminal cleavage/methylation domain-containing protein
MKQRPNGFTIIEVTLVLAIAGIILMTVVMALPALQRSSRNNARKQDVNIMLQAVSKWTLNHSGALPQHSDRLVLLQFARLSHYQTTDFHFFSVSPSDFGSKGPVNNASRVEVYNFQKCDPNSIGRSIGDGAGYRDVVALYGIETRAGDRSQCQQL